MDEASAPVVGASAAADGPLRLHIGGTEPKEGWRILNIQTGPHVDFVGDCSSLAQFPDSSIERIYASHVYEHLSHRGELQAALSEAHRVLIPGGPLQISVPDFIAIAAMISDPARTAAEQSMLMCMIFGGQGNPYNFHKSGLTEKILDGLLADAGITGICRVLSFDLFKDWSGVTSYGRPISLNMESRK